ncbi:type II toxin-antitoxin system RelE/ParE family toxin [Patescibacteria group bacterium]|nr:type II toxin-antitoxin system RelE/ParE family toxin [Patescibacteria group bacterium]MCG2702044.1 type II toxin-antitoxin system RelE/ParE family toxin [Candidatus Parcubacteria bacterium]MBU4265563.1 type II toxin-antitoxin system RelE/ParE family toxin [Patescibacteria group bacterium]MBU4389892.1 type II toxin-antitoxin system RelE/ParE family toxin [Patescibacteria group bacterium]MBU4397235.1 type II toxin-antitoxin system RelE/ParE family toxin [Patescibacteria group bacterium]
MKYEVKFSDEGCKKLKKLSRSDTERVLLKLNVLEDFSMKVGNIKKMRSTIGDVYRLRVGKLRVIFEVDERNKKIWVLSAGYRGGIY